LQGPATWTGDQLVALASTEYGSDPLRTDYLTYPVGWDPSSRSTVELTLPPHNVYEPVLAGSRLAFFDQGLAYDLTTDSWVTLGLDEDAFKALELAGHTAVWAGDRLLVWGGVHSCGETPPKFGTMVELIPQWTSDGSTATALPRQLAVSTGSTDPRGTAGPSSLSFAC
jgi:hypothetical protein